MRILTIDDDASVRRALTVSLQLQWQDIEVLQAGDGETGLEETDHVRGLKLGADEYLEKPIRHATLVAHIKSAVRRAGGVPPVWA